jgi:N-(2-amino-2-carboxyethyl)-L-glutamate synthase
VVRVKLIQMVSDYSTIGKKDTIDGMLRKMSQIGCFIGHTPLKRLDFDGAELYVKLEYTNYSGSIKDRPAYNILLKAIELGLITKSTVIVESSSGNFAIALASLCKILSLKSIMVIDPNINIAYERVLGMLASKVVKVTKRDETGGFLLTRLNVVREICLDEKDAYWTNQYENPNNYLSYYHGLGEEICNSFEKLDFAFIGVSTCGTIVGLSAKLKEKFPLIKIIAVDVDGSVIFGSKAKPRHISGLGASQTSPLLDKALIDDVINVTELNIVKGCKELLSEHGIFGGASAGAMYYASTHFFNTHKFSGEPKALFLCPDKGTSYLDNVYSSEWVEKNLY